MNNRGHMVTKFAYPDMPKISQEFLPFSGYGVLDGGIVSGVASSGLMALNVVKTPTFLNSGKRRELPVLIPQSLQIVLDPVVTTGC